ncbi:glycosyltransferase family 1 protein [Halomarina halobia]|uniref:Glycosyltransferase family 1 protein n=1 Tax=Halomarina halobia TaxID=3033386 RepID=A0ABD6ACU7_9EURY|nr:hypothetical protein [Halomarina sp. PSR21]
MRVLVVPEVYRPRDATACGTLRDAVAWIGRWLDLDPALHVYWLLPPRAAAGYERADVLADRERVTLLEAESLGRGADRDLLTDTGYTTAQLEAIREGIFEADAYLDAVVDQLRSGRFLLYKWLLEHVDHWAASVRPFDVIANVHDLQVPLKYRYCSYRNDFQMYMECCAVAFADGRWFTADVDRRQFRAHARGFLRPEVVARADADALSIGSPIDVDAFDETYASAPRTLHLAGSMWSKKNVDQLLAIGERLHERFGVGTVLTSMEAIPAAASAPEWVTAYPNADRATYERTLREGDLAVCASEYETMARTPFEQAASGQVLLLRDEPWIEECVPADHPLVAPLDGLADLAVSAVERWGEAVAANRRLVEYVTRERSPEAVGERTYADLRRRVERKRRAYEAAPPPALEVVARVLTDVEGAVALDSLVRRTAEYTADGRPFTADPDHAFVDLVYALRSLGYVDAGNPGTPVFRPA